MNKKIAAISFALALATSLPAIAATPDAATCEASWMKMESKSGFITGADAQRHMDMMKKAGKPTAAADRVTDKEFMDACRAGIFETGQK